MVVQVFTDGSCLGNPGPGGWAFLVRLGKKEIKKQGGEAYTTNNRMELQAVIEGLKWLSQAHPQVKEIEIYSDSSWVVSTLKENWKRKKNLDLWERLTPLIIKKGIHWHWIRGHRGHKENEDCDRRAQKEAWKQKKISGAVEFIEGPPTLL